MEWKIGEIRQVNGEWYQCVESDSCGECSLFTTECGSGTKSDLADKVFGQCCKVRRTDNKHVIFKKLEKVGGPIVRAKRHIGQKHDHWFRYAEFQKYKVYIQPVLPKEPFTDYDKNNDIVYIEINQNKEDMEEQHSTENYPTKEEKIAGRIANKVGEDIQNQLEKNMNKLKLKPFSLEAAKAGKPVCTRDGAKARIICFDAKSDAPIIALITTDDGTEIAFDYLSDGTFFNSENPDNDLMMLSEKKEGWVNVYSSKYSDKPHTGNKIFDSKKEALEKGKEIDNYIATSKIEYLIY